MHLSKLWKLNPSSIESLQCSFFCLSQLGGTLLTPLCYGCITASGSIFHQLLAATRKRRKITKPPNKGHEPHANQVSNKGTPFWKGLAPQQPSKQLPTISTLQLNLPPPHHMAWDLLLLPAPTADSSPLLIPRPWGDHIPLLPFWAWNPLIWPRGLDMAIQEDHKRSDWSLDHNGRYLSSWNDLTVKKSAFKSSAVSFCTGLPGGLPIKENLGEPNLQSAASDRHRHTLRGHNLNHTIWILYAESVS